MNDLDLMPSGNDSLSGPGAWKVTRRVFLKTSGLAMAGFSPCASMVYADATGPGTILRFGIVTDSHYAERDKGMRYYSASAVKMTECVTRMNQEKISFLIELGDFKDQGEPASEKDTLRYLDTIEKIFRQFNGPRYHVLGNHDEDSISKKQFLGGVENTGIGKEACYYSFDSNGLHFVVLDANFRADGSDYDHGNFDWTDANIPPLELDWLRNDLAATSKPVIVFAHQRLDGTGDIYIKNAAEVRKILQESGKVLIVFQGHHHAGGYSRIENIHYYTLKAMVEGSGIENNSYAVVEVESNHNIIVSGYRKAVNKTMEKS